MYRKTWVPIVEETLQYQMEAENFVDKSSVIRKKEEFQNGGNKKSKHAKFSEKRTFLTP